MMKKLLILSCVSWLAACAGPAEVRDEYTGQDAGRIAIGISAASGTQYTAYSLLFRPVGEARGSAFIYYQNNPFARQQRDLDTPTENGVVQSFRLKPGQYEIYRFQVGLNTGMVVRTFTPPKDFAIPFTVRANQTTYLGHYQAHGLSGKNILGAPVPAGVIFALSDRQDEDLALLRKRLGTVDFGTISNATPSAASIGIPAFIDADRLGSINKD